MTTLPAAFDEQLISHLRTVVDDRDIGCGLPNSAYTSPDIAAFERDTLFANSWTAIAYESDVRKPGSAHPVKFLGLPLLAVRSRDGQVNVFHNVCRHRGMTLVEEPSQLRTVLRCPYHSWAYDFDGNLVSTPLIGGVDKNECDGFDKSRHGLREVRSACWMGIIFVNLSADATTFESFIQPLEQRWRPLLGAQERGDIGPAATGSHQQLSLNCNWKLAVENYCEAYHLPWVHPALNSYSPLEQHFGISEGDYIAGQATKVYELATTMGTQLPLIEGWPTDKIKYAEYMSLYPNTLLGLQADHFFSVIVLPTASDRTIERLQISYINEAVHDEQYSTCRAAVLKSWDTVFKEDIFAVEGMQRGRASPGFDGGILTPIQDKPTRHFHTWTARQYLQELTALPD